MEELQGYPVADDKEIRDAHNKAVSLIEHNVDEFFDCFPGANSENNFYRQTENTDWTEGFWTGELWLAYESNKDDKLKEAALCQVDNFLYRIEHHINTDHHDMGFLYSPSCVAAYKLTGSEVGKRAALLAADNLMKRFHEKGQFFQAWGKIGDKDNYRLIIDCLMNMPLLFWASKVTGDKKYEEKLQDKMQQLTNRRDEAVKGLSEDKDNDKQGYKEYENSIREKVQQRMQEQADKSHTHSLGRGR